MRERSTAGTIRAPEFPSGLEWLNTERPLTLAQLRGKFVILDFWTYGCINCMHILPDLQRLEAEYSRELVVIGVHSAKFTNEGQTSNIRQIILRYGIHHPVVNDRDFAVWEAWAVHAWPTLMLVDPAGYVVGMHRGEGVYPVFQPLIADLIKAFDANGRLDRVRLDLQLEATHTPETVLAFPGKVLADGANGRLFISDTNHNRIIVAESRQGYVLNVIGRGARGRTDGDFQQATFAQPQGLALASDGLTLYVADTGNHAIRRVDLVAERVTTLAGTGQQARAYPPQGGKAPGIDLNSPWDLALDGQQLYIAMAGTHQIWGMDLPSSFIGPLAGNAREGTLDGPLALAELAQPSGLALDGAGLLYVADAEASTIRRVETRNRSGQVSTLAGGGTGLFDWGDNDGIGRTARFQHPLGVAADAGTLYVADTYNSKIKRIDAATGQTTTLLGSDHGWADGTAPRFYEPGGLDVANGTLYIADTNNHAIRVVDLATLQTSTLVLKGIERFVAANQFDGRVVHLPPVSLDAAETGRGKLVLEIDLPEGYKLNAYATHSVCWWVEGDALHLPPDASRNRQKLHLPIELDVTLQPGESILYADLTIFYCETVRDGICLVEYVRLTAPVHVGGEPICPHRANGSSDAQVARLHHRIVAPEIVGAVSF